MLFNYVHEHWISKKCNVYLTHSWHYCGYYVLIILGLELIIKEILSS